MSKNSAIKENKCVLAHENLDLVAIVPAAGVGKRMGAHCPKQYLTIDDKTVLEHTVHCLLAHKDISQVVVVIGEQDPYFQKTFLMNDPRVLMTTGGDERADSVLAGLKATNATWVMVHDGARPCVRHDDIDALIDAARVHQDGAILATPVRDTMKRSDHQGKIESTVCREQLWHALTPQMFRRQSLLDAFECARIKKQTVTDEASAMELMGAFPQLVLGHADNIKVTWPEDLILAAFFLSQKTQK